MNTVVVWFHSQYLNITRWLSVREIRQSGRNVEEKTSLIFFCFFVSFINSLVFFNALTHWPAHSPHTSTSSFCRFIDCTFLYSAFMHSFIHPFGRFPQFIPSFIHFCTWTGSSQQLSDQKEKSSQFNTTQVNTAAQGSLYCSTYSCFIHIKLQYICIYISAIITEPSDVITQICSLVLVFRVKVPSWQSHLLAKNQFSEKTLHQVRHHPFIVPWIQIII